MNIEEKIKQLVADRLGIEPTFSLGSSFPDLGADSLDAVELIMALEDEFNIEIPDTESQKIKTVQMAVDAVKEKLNGSN